MSVLEVDPVGLSDVAERLQRAGSAIAELAQGVPQAPDAGEMSADVAAVLGHLVAGVGELAGGVIAAGDAVARGVVEYVDQDAAVRRAMSQSAG